MTPINARRLLSGVGNAHFSTLCAMAGFCERLKKEAETAFIQGLSVPRRIIIDMTEG